MSKIVYTKEVLEAAVKQAFYYTELFAILGARLGGNTCQRVKQLIQDYQIDVSHFKDGRRKGFIHSGIGQRKHYQDVLVDGYTRRVSGKQLRRALIESGRPYVCELCQIGPEWNGKPLTIQVDHIDGDWRNCKPSNLQFACPNCHSQLLTSCNQDTGKRCKNCHKRICSQSTWCERCAGKYTSHRKVENRPDLRTLLAEVETLGYAGTGRKYGVSDNCIRKWIKQYFADQLDR